MRVPKYRKHSSGVAFIEHKGKRHYLPGPFGSRQSKAAYRAYVNRYGGGFFDEHRPENESIAISVLVMAYLDYAATYYPTGRDSEYAFLVIVLKRFNARFGETLVSEFTGKMLNDWQVELSKRRVALSRTKDAPTKPISRNYINKHSARVKRMFKWGTAESLVPGNVYMQVSAVPGLKAGRSSARETTKKTPVPLDHFTPVLDSLGPAVRAMAWLQWYTGARPGSVCEARANQFERTGELWTWRPIHKTRHLGKVLEIPIGPKAQEILAPFLDAAAKPDAPLFAPRSVRKSHRYKATYSTRSYNRAVGRAIKRVNGNRKDPIPVWTVHQIRHSKGHAIRATYGAEAAQAVLGHERLNSTELYSERRTELAKKVASETG